MSNKRIAEREASLFGKKKLFKGTSFLISFKEIGI